MMRKMYSLLFLFIGIFVSSCSDNGKEVFDEYYIETTNSKQYNLQQLKTMLPEYSAFFDMFGDINIDAKAITYYSEDRNGDKIKVSGLIAYPSSGVVKGFICAPNHTITSNAEAPTVSMFAINASFALLGYAVIIPDYIGFGVTSDIPHPYVQRELTGKTCIDMIFAAREFFEKQQITIPKEISIMGYSQGGASALFVQRMIEEKYSSLIPIKHVYSGGGPHYMSKMFEHYSQTDYTGYPCAIPDVIIGSDYALNLKLNYNNVFISPLLENHTNWYGSKKYNSTEINKLLGSNIASSFMHEDMFKPALNSDFKKITDACIKNDNIDWTPKAPIYLLHSQADEAVPFFCSEEAYKSFKSKGANVEFTIINTQLHLEAMIVFYVQVISKLMK